MQKSYCLQQHKKLFDKDKHHELPRTQKAGAFAHFANFRTVQRH